MSFPAESLKGFVQAAHLGTFSSAARALGKSQSTVSEAIANLEIDLNVCLFDRSQRQPVLTEVGRVLLDDALRVLAANNQLQRSASQLAKGLEPRLTVAWSDMYQPERLASTLTAIDQRFPGLELECLVAEYDAVLALVQRGSAHVGVMVDCKQYPPDIGHITLTQVSEIVLCASRSHPLSMLAAVNHNELRSARALCLSTDQKPQLPETNANNWFAPDHLMLLEMVRMGFGWAELPRWMVQRFGCDQLVELPVPGWPRRTPLVARLVDAPTPRNCRSLAFGILVRTSLSAQTARTRGTFDADTQLLYSHPRHAYATRSNLFLHLRRLQCHLCPLGYGCRGGGNFANTTTVG
jgi:DNA-binding transcriptional LysR family regulator